MEFGHHGRRHHHRDGGDNEEEEYPPPPPPPPPQSYYGGYEPPPSQATHVYHSSSYTRVGEGGYQGPPPPPPPPYYDAPPRPPPSNYSAFLQQEDSSPSYPRPAYSSSSVQHVSHDLIEQADPPLESETQHHYRPHLPSFIHHHTHQGSELTNKPTVRVFCKAETGYSLTIRDGKVILARSDNTDDFQHWIKDEKYSTRVKDEEGFPSFALVSKATGQAMKHSIGATHPVQLIAYNPDVLDESVLWTQSKDLGDGFRTIRMVNNIRLNVDAFHGDKNHGGVCDGTTIVLWEWKKGDNQRWKIIPY